ncbi:odorant receptor 2a isoform X2 [Cryptotermes secundus]|uniref:odorant receptor 2a isoform X2 n=1 Tax=Cryptotermes secundus TaxID=105785 RepID=UPI000CD7DB6F|nr:odorant receptor 2a isoform X2 [Cryptotermes secundus]
MRRFLRELQDTYRLVLLGPFLIIACGMCVNTFSILLSWGKAMDSLQAATLIAALTSQLYVYCWFGSELTQQSAELRDAVWGCNWVGAPLVEQRALIFMMEVAAEFTLSAGGIIPASRHTMMQILNQTYSFLMFLMNFMDN